MQSTERYKKFISQFLYLIKAVKQRSTRRALRNVIQRGEQPTVRMRTVPAEKFRRMRFIKILLMLGERR